MSEQQNVEGSGSLMTAFLITIDKDGNPGMVLEVQGLEMDRAATLKDARRAMLDLTADLAAQASAQYTLAMVQASSQPDPTPGERVAEALAKREGSGEE